MPTVLIVEDETSISNLYQFKLGLSGFKTIQAFNGLEGLKKAEQEAPDLVLLDLRMPIMSGEEFLQYFRKNKVFADIPVIVLTNISRDEAPKTLWHYGISGYFVKASHTPSELIDIIVKTLNEF